MAILFAGGEDHDFAKIGACTVNTVNTNYRRAAYARCSLSVGFQVAAPSTDGWQGTFSATATSFWLTARYFNTSNGFISEGYNFLSCSDGLVRRLLITPDANGKWRLSKQNAAGTRTTLATSINSYGVSAVTKLDLQVINYGVSGTVNVYIDNVLWMTFTGDITTDSSTSLSSFVLGPLTYNGNGPTEWSEVIVANEDTRSMSLVTLPPAANGNTFAWTNTFASINETTLDDATLCASATANQILETTVTSTGVPAQAGILAVCVSARGQKGATGPQNLQMAVRTGTTLTDYFSATKALPTAFDRVAHVFETNPATSTAWSASDLTAAGFNIGARSIT